MENLSEKFQNKKGELLKLYDVLVEYEFIPFQDNDINYDVNTISEIKNKLDSEQFIISVCGVIKCGKSSLLNNIIFDDEPILPVDVTPETAVLTRIKYGNVKKAKVIFYNEEEWEKIKNDQVTENGEVINYFNKYLKDLVNKSAKKGVYNKEIIHKEPYSKELNDFNNLKSYVSRDGEYSPFVKSVEIEVPNKFIKDVEIVDTPGLNDPNELRSKLTKDWIFNSNAVIFLTNSIQAFTKFDWNFIDSNLSFIDSSKIIFAITKIDEATDYELVKNKSEYDIKNNENFKKRNLLLDKKVLAISTIAAIINNKIKKEKELTDLEKKIHSKHPGLVSNIGFIDEFKETIGEQLMKDKGESIIKSNKTKIAEFCNLKIKTLERNLLTREKKKEAFGLTIKEIESKKMDIKDIREKIDNLRKDTSKDIEIQTSEIRRSISKYIIEEIIEPTKEKFEEWIMDDEISATDAISSTGFQIKKFLGKFTRGLDEGHILSSKFSDKLEEIKTELEKNIKEITKKEFSSRATKFYTKSADLINIINELLVATKKDLNESKLSELRERVWGFLWTKKIKTKQNILNEVDDVLETLKTQIRNNVNPVIKTEIIDYFKKIFDDVESLLTNFNKSYSEVENEQGDKENQKGIIENDIALIEKDKEKFKKYSEEIFSKLKNI